MKQLFKVFLVAIFAIFAVSTEASAQKKKEAEVTFSVNIDCPNCVKKLESSLPFEKGVKDLKISLEEQTIWFKYQEGKTTKEELAKAIKKMGYEVSEVKKEEKKQ